jgi:triacylglycerol lipase
MSEYKFTADFSKFNTTATKYNGENGLVLADCAKLAYEKDADIKDAMNTWGLTKFEFFEGLGKSTEAFIAGNDKTIIVAFRGTQEPKDFIKDAKFALTDAPYGKVHDGFYEGLNEVWDKMFETIERFRDNNQSVWFCGHSLGAALATLAVAEYVLVKGKTINGLYTIGQPRTGNDVFANNFDAKLKDKCFRFVNNADIVTRNPIPGLFLKYRHIGVPYYIDGKGELQSSISLVEKATDIMTSMANGLLKNHKLEDFGDHKSESYVELILKNSSKSFS